MLACVCATGGTALVTLIIVVTKASLPHHICHHPFPESVGGRGRMKMGSLKGRRGKKEREEGRQGGKMTVNGHPHSAIWEVVWKSQFCAVPPGRIISTNKSSSLHLYLFSSVLMHLSQIFLHSNFCLNMKQQTCSLLTPHTHTHTFRVVRPP